MMVYNFITVIACLIAFVSKCNGAVLNFQDLGGIPLINDSETQWLNGALLNKTLNSLQPGDVFIVPNTTFFTMGGILVTNPLTKVRFELAGTLSFSQDRDTWPRSSNGRVLECLDFTYLEDVTFTSPGGANNRGTLNGNGEVWWGAIQFLLHQEDRPRLFHIAKSKNILFEKFRLINSPYWTFWAENSDVLEVRDSEIDVRWDRRDSHTYIDLQAFNTDGFDVTGQYVHIHDVKIWNDDDCVAIKDGSKHMLIERIEASGLGLVIGSIGSSVVHNITFRDAVMHKTVKGIYMKTRWYDEAPAGEEVASITDILFQNITMYEPQQFAIWIGPAQQTGQPCSLLWPHMKAECKMSGYQIWRNITLRDITVHHARQSPGVIMGNSSNPIQGLTLENVVFHEMKSNSKPFAEDYYCPKDGVADSHSLGATSPVPLCIA